MSGVHIRRLTPADADTAGDIVHQAYAPYVERLGTQPGPMLEEYHAVLRRHPAWGAYEGDALLGLLVVHDDGKRFVLENVAVHPEAQGRGIGKALLAHGELEARNRGYDRVELYTNVAMTENIALYARLGYVETDRRREDGFDRVYMAKGLAR